MPLEPPSLEELVGDDVPVNELSRLARVDALLRSLGPVQPVRFAHSEPAKEYPERSRRDISTEGGPWGWGCVERLP
jgi:hypothetical protein